MLRAIFYATMSGWILACVLVFGGVLILDHHANWHAFIGFFVACIALVVNLMYLALAIVRVVEAKHGEH